MLLTSASNTYLGTVAAGWTQCSFVYSRSSWGWNAHFHTLEGFLGSAGVCDAPTGTRLGRLDENVRIGPMAVDGVDSCRRGKHREGHKAVSKNQVQPGSGE